jgi:hypothetical protein
MRTANLPPLTGGPQGFPPQKGPIRIPVTHVEYQPNQDPNTLANFVKWKQRYTCTLGMSSTWCDGTNSARCPQAINCKDGSRACQLGVNKQL